MNNKVRQFVRQVLDPGGHIFGVDLSLSAQRARKTQIPIVDNKGLTGFAIWHTKCKVIDGSFDSSTAATDPLA